MSTLPPTIQNLLLQIKALHQDYVALQNQILKKNLQAASKETKALIKLVEQKTGQPFLKIAQMGITLLNSSNNVVFFKPDDGITAERVEAGGWTTDALDGIATELCPNQVLKVSGLNNAPFGLGLTVLPGGIPIYANAVPFIGGISSILAFGEIAQVLAGRTGIKDRTWLQEQQAQRDNGWNALFEAAATF